MGKGKRSRHRRKRGNDDQCANGESGSSRPSTSNSQRAHEEGMGEFVRSDNRTDLREGINTDARVMSDVILDKAPVCESSSENAKEKALEEQERTTRELESEDFNREVTDDHVTVLAVHHDPAVLAYEVQREGSIGSWQMNDMEEIRRVRAIVGQALKEVRIRQHIPDGEGHLICPFFQNGCKYKFTSREHLRLHVENCLYGLYQFCKETACSTLQGEIHRSVHLFSKHVAEEHGCLTTDNMLEVNGIEVRFPFKVLELNIDGYHLIILRRLHFVLEERLVGVLVGVIVQNIRLDFMRVIIAPVIYDVNNGEQLNHIIDMECTLFGRNGLEILPISYPGLNEHYVMSSVLSRAYVHPRIIVEAAAHLDGVHSYSSHHLRYQGLTFQDENDGFVTVSMNLKLYPFRCVIKEDAEFPIVSFGSIWKQLRLNLQVIGIMEDGEDCRPSEVSGAVIPQLLGQADLMIECIYDTLIHNSVMPTIYNFVMEQIPRPRIPPRNILAWILFPTVSLLRMFVADWKPNAVNLGIGFFVMESPFPEIKDQIRRFGSDILITLPTALHDTIRYGDAELKNILVNDVKYVYLPTHEKNCFPDNRQRLQFVMDQLNMQSNETIRIAHVKCMHASIWSHSRDLRVMDHQETPSAIFPRGFNFLSLGPDPKRVLNELVVHNIPYTSYDDRKMKIVRLISSQEKMRWLVIGMNGQTNTNGTILGNLVAAIDEEFKDVSRVKCVTQEKEIMINSCCWDPFLERPDAIMIGPFFLLDSPQSRFCDSLILLTEPVYEAEKVRIKELMTTDDNQQKPVYIFSSVHSMMKKKN